MGVDDELTKGTDRMVPRADVAEVVVRCLEAGAYTRPLFGST